MQVVGIFTLTYRLLNRLFSEHLPLIFEWLKVFFENNLVGNQLIWAVVIEFVVMWLLINVIDKADTWFEKIKGVINRLMEKFE